MLDVTTSRRRGWNLCLLALLAWSLCIAPTAALAWQDAPAEAAPADAAPVEAAPVEGAAPAETAAPEVAEQRSFLAWAIQASGICGLFILICSFILVAVASMIVMQYRRDNMIPGAFVDAFEQKLQAKDYQGAYETARSDDSLIARVLAAGLGKLNRGYEEAVEGMQEVGEEETMTIDHKLSYISLIAGIAPMLGLLGTVQGMIMSFQEISTSPTQPKPKDLAEGISTALFTTLEGLIVAIPAMIAFSMLRNRIARIMLEVGMISEGLMSRFAAMGKAKATGGAAPATAPARQAE